ncbi:hypothetical protein [Intrasporangium mesophilum]
MESLGEPDVRTRLAARDLSESTVRRGVATMCLLGMALIHLLDLPDKLEEVPYIGALFIGLIVAALVLAEALIRTDDVRVWIAAGALAAATILGYTLSRSIGLPGEEGAEIGNWTEGLGIASLLIEAALVLLAVLRVTRHRD